MSIQLANRPKLSSKVHSQIFHAYCLPNAQPISFPSESPFTRQEYAAECDINTIMARYQSTGEMPRLNQGTAQFLDVSSSLVFQESMNYVAEAQSMFAELPSAIRDRFYNDPAQFLNFCSNPANRVELAKMGLLTPEAAKAVLNPVPATPVAGTPVKAPEKPPEAAE